MLALLEFYQEGFQSVIDKVKSGVEKGLKFACGKLFEKMMSLLHFLPANDARKKDRLLCVDVAKVFFGSCLQLCFQLVLLVGYTNPDDRELSQYLSIAASSYLLCKTGVDIILFRRSTDEEENEQKKRLFNYLYLILTDTLQNISFTPQKTCLEKLKAFIKHFLIEQFQKMKILLFYLPLVLTSLVFHTGTLVVTILALDGYSAIYICLVFAVNLLVSIILPFESVQALEHKLGLQYKFDQKNGSETESGKEKVVNATVFRGFLISWINIFFISRPVETCSYFRTIQMVLLQISRFILNIITIVVLIVYATQFSGFEEGLKTSLGYALIGLIFVGIANIVLVFLYTYHYKPGCCRETKHESKLTDSMTKLTDSVAKLTDSITKLTDSISNVEEANEAKCATDNGRNNWQDEGCDCKIENMVITQKPSTVAGNSDIIRTTGTDFFNNIIPSEKTLSTALNIFKNGSIFDGQETTKSKDTTEKAVDDSLKVVITETQRSVAGNSHTVELKMMPFLVLKQN